MALNLGVEVYSKPGATKARQYSCQPRLIPDFGQLLKTASRKAYLSGHMSWRNRHQESSPFSIRSPRALKSPQKLQKRACVVQVFPRPTDAPLEVPPTTHELDARVSYSDPETHRYMIDTLSFGSDQEDFPEVHVWPKRTARLGRGLGTRRMRALPLAEPATDWLAWVAFLPPPLDTDTSGAF